MLHEVLRRLDAPSPSGNVPHTVVNFNNQGMQAQKIYQAETMNFSAREAAGSLLPADLADPRDILAELNGHFSVDEMREICFALGVDDENVIVGAKNASALELVKYMQRRDRLPDLVTAMRKVLGESGH